MAYDLPISSSSIVARGDGFVQAEIDNEIVALNIETGTCYGLNRVGSRIWELIESPSLVADVCKKLMAEYDVEPTTCERQVLDLLEELRAEGLVTLPDKK